MTEIEVLPRCTVCRSAILDALAIDQNFDRTYVADEVACIGVGLGQRGGRDPRVVLRRLRDRCPSQACNSNKVIGSLAL
jgi:hypothetical protein